MKALLQWIQIGNWLSKSYRENASTDTATVVGGVSITAAVAAVLTTLAAVKPNLGLTAELIGTVTALVGGAASQIVPAVKNWIDQRKAKRIAEAKDAVDAWADELRKKRAEDLAAAAAAPVVPGVNPLDLMIETWTDTNGKQRPSSESCETVGEAITWGAVLVKTADGRVYDCRTREFV